jgi:lipopolysaccharide export system protein LptA
MPYPVPPPEPSAIIYIAKPKKVALTVATNDGDTRSNSAQIPEASPEIVEPEPTAPQPEPSAALLGTTEATSQSPEIAAPLTSVESGGAATGFQPPVVPAEKSETAEAQKDASFTSYQLGSVENAIAARNRQRTAGDQSKKDNNAVRQPENGYQAKGEQLKDNSPEPAEIVVPEPPETPPAKQQEFEIPTTPTTPTTPPGPKPATPAAPKPQPKPAVPGVRTAPSQRTVPFPVSPADTIEIKADSQEFDDKQQIVTAVGRVVVRFRQTVIDADRAIVNLVTRQVIASGNVAYTRGQQVVRGRQMEFNLGLNSGAVEQASGEIFLPAAGSELTPTLPTDISAGTILEQPLSDRLTSQQPLRGVKSPGAATITIGGGGAGGAGGAGGGGRLTAPQITGAVNRVRFEAERLELLPNGVRVATNIRITNDPFSPPELEYRARRATITRISPTAEELVTNSPRLVFDNRIKIPVYPRRQVFDSQQKNGPCLTFGYDGGDRGGLFAECGYEVFQDGPVRLTLTPQIYLQRIVEKNGGNPFSPDSYGLKAKLGATLGPRTSLEGSALFLNFDNFPNLAENAFRGNLRLRQSIGNHNLAAEYSYRDRLFNGSLGFQTVNSSLGAVLTSPQMQIGNTGINFSYQAGYQFINADTDRADLLDPVRENNRIDLGRGQVSVALSRGFNLWQGKPLPRTPTQGLRYTRTPVVPFLQLALGVRGVGSYYSSGDRQNSIASSIGIQGQFGHFSRPFLDYTGFNVTYTQVARDGVSPYLFDRLVDLKVLSFGLVQQVYGGFRVGFQSAINLDSRETISTNYTLEYSRRSYAIILRFNPERQVGSLTFRISDFNWNGTPQPFSGDVRTVEGGVRLSD